MVRTLAFLVLLTMCLSCERSISEDQRRIAHSSTKHAHSNVKNETPASPVVEPAKAAPVDEDKVTHLEARTEERPLPRFMRPEWVIVYVTVVYVTIAGFTLLAIWRQANLLDRQIAAAEYATEKQLRAYVHVNSAALKFLSPGVPEAQIHFKNSGQTPAYEVRGWIHTWIAKHPLTENLPLPPDDLVQGIETMAPGRISIFVSPEKPRLCSFLNEDLGHADATLYVYGGLSYADAFGIRHETKYRLIYGGLHGIRKVPNRGGEDIWILSPDTFGNEST